MQGNWIMNARADAGMGEVGLQGVALLDADDEQVIDRVRPRGLERCPNRVVERSE